MEPEHEATSWEANVVRNLETMPRASSPLPEKEKYFGRFGTGHGQ